MSKDQNSSNQSEEKVIRIAAVGDGPPVPQPPHHLTTDQQPTSNQSAHDGQISQTPAPNSPPSTKDSAFKKFMENCKRILASTNHTRTD